MLNRNIYRRLEILQRGSIIAHIALLDTNAHSRMLPRESLALQINHKIKYNAIGYIRSGDATIFPANNTTDYMHLYT